MPYRHMGVLLVALYKQAWKRIKLQMVALAFKQWKRTPPRQRTCLKHVPDPTRDHEQFLEWCENQIDKKRDEDYII